MLQLASLASILSQFLTDDNIVSLSFTFGSARGKTGQIIYKERRRGGECLLAFFLLYTIRPRQQTARVVKNFFWREGEKDKKERLVCGQFGQSSSSGCGHLVCTTF